MNTSFTVILFLLMSVSLSKCVVTDTDDDIEEKLRTLSENLDGDIILKSDEEYAKLRKLKNTRFNSNFLAVAMVKSTMDVRKVLLFCVEEDLRPTVRSSGHDYIGRASGAGSVNINLRNMKDITIKQQDPLNDGGPTIRVQSGASWGEVYYQVYLAGYLQVGGSAQTVAPGGYTTGGGHSPLSPKLGLGADSCLQFTIVTANGSIITTTYQGGTIQESNSSPAVPFNDKEFFWAVLGGGGGTFGVVTEFVYKLHQPPADGLVYMLLSYPMKKIDGTEVAEPVIKAWSDLILNKLGDSWSGYGIFSNGKGEGYEGTVAFSLLHWGGWASAQNVINQMLNIYPQHRFGLAQYNVSDFYDYEKNINDPTGFAVFLINRFIQEADLLPDSTLPSHLANLQKFITDKTTITCTIALLGGKNGAAYNNPNSSRNSVSPKFRSSYGSLSCGIGWESCTEDNATIDWFKTFGNPLYNIGDGVYFNEPDFDLQNWKVEYWGSMDNYNRLLKVKQRYDPDNKFWCHHCVGSDLVTGISPGPEACNSLALQPISSLLFTVTFLLLMMNLT